MTQLAALKREYIEVPLGLIDEPVLPSRTSMDEDKLDELASNIRANGLLQPISLARVGARFVVLAGHRRTLACKRVGIAVVPAVVYPEGTTFLQAVQYAENRHREDLNPADEAIWFNELLETACGNDIDNLCELLKEKRAYVENRLLLFHGHEDVFKALQAAEISIGVAQQLNKCTDAGYARMLLHQAVTGGATVATVSGWILDWKKECARLVGIAPSDAPPIQMPAIPETNFFRCVVCGGNEHVHTMQPINVHMACRVAILDKLLAAYRGEN